jgi:hypothetical protein
MLYSVDSHTVDDEDIDGQRKDKKKKEGDNGGLETLPDGIPFLGKMVRILVKRDHISHQTRYRTAGEADDDNDL